jgi:hypothetical protein
MRSALPFIAMFLVANVVWASPQDDARNAATWYRRAIEKYRAIEVTQADWMDLGNFEGDMTRGPSPNVRRVIARFQPAIEMTDRAAAQGACDYQLDLGNGPLTDYQGIADRRRLVHLLRYDMCVRIFDGDAANASDRAVTVYRMGNHMKTDGRYVGSLVSEALFHFGENLSTTLVDHAMLGPDEAAKILASVDSITQDDPFGYQQSVKNEKEFVVDWAREQFAGEGGVERLTQNCDWLSDQHDGKISPIQLATIAGLSQESLDSSLAESSRMMDVVVSAFANPNTEEAKADLAALDERMNDPECGPLVRMIIGKCAYSNIFQRMLDSKQKIVERRAMLQSVIDGKFDTKAHANAAIWYLRATLAITALDQALLDRVREYSKAHAQAPDDAVAAFLDSAEVQSIVNTLREASEMTRCDFDAASPWEGPFPAYQPGLRDAARLLIADAAAQLHGDGGGTSALDRLSICCAISAHLAMDRLAISAVVAHENFNQTANLTSRALDANQFTNEDRAILKATLPKLEPADPFGYQRTTGKTREFLNKWFGYTIQNDDREVLDAMHALIAQSEPERLVWLCAIGDHSAYRGAVPPYDVIERLSHCADFIDLKALQTANEQANDVRNMIARGESLRVLEMPCATIVPIAARSAQAPEDVQRLTRIIDRSPVSE